MGIHLTGTGESFVVDDEDDKYIHGHTWSWKGGKNKVLGMATKINQVNKTTLLGRFLMELKKEDAYKKLVLHKDGNKLNFRKTNLAVVDKTIVAGTSTIHQDKKLSKFKGVQLSKTNNSRGKFYDRKKGIYTSTICVKGVEIWLGGFDTEVEAAKAYNDAALKYFGNTAKLNSLI